MTAQRKQLNTDASSVASEGKQTEQQSSRSVYEQFCTSVKAELFK